MSMLLLFFCSSTTPDASQMAPQEPVEPPSPFVDAGAVTPALEVSDELAAALRDEEHALAAELLDPMPASPERDLLLAWSLVMSDRAEEAVRFKDLEGPVDMVGLIEGRANLDRNRLAEADVALSTVPAQSLLYREALAWRAEALTRMGSLDEARGLLEELVSVPDPAEGSLEALQQLHNLEPDAGWDERIWTYYPSADVELDLGWPAATHRAEQIMWTGDWDGALAALDGVSPQGNDADACRYAYVKGRSLYKKNEKEAAEAALKAACTDDEYGPKVYYLRARNAYRRGHHTTATTVYVEMADTWPDHTFADDGLVLAGRSRKKAGDMKTAQDLWKRAFDEYPDGDMTAEGMFELGWTHYLNGDATAAYEAWDLVGSLDVEVDPKHVTGGRYWAGRMALYPDVDNPTAPNEEGRTDAIERWASLVQDQPWSYYAVLAQARLLEEAPERALSERAIYSPPSTWTLRRELAEGPAPQLLALGLVDLAAANLPEDLDTDEQAWWYASRMAVGDGLQAHREMRRWVPTPTEPSGDAVQLLNVAFPDYWLEEVSLAAEGDRYDVRYFHGLVRVESDFDPSAVSWAGARGLCQVMPATGRGVGEWMGMTVTKEDLLVPETNLKVGARYMDELHKMFGNNPALAAAGYNAGEHRVKTWLGKWGNLPTDEYVERIPFDETRGYAKKVVGTWQTYHWLRGEGAPMVDLSAYNHTAVPE